WWCPQTSCITFSCLVFLTPLLFQLTAKRVQVGIFKVVPHCRVLLGRWMQPVATPAKIRLNSALTATVPVTSRTCGPRGRVHGTAGGQHCAERTTARTRDPCPPYTAWLRLHERGQRGTATRHARARSIQTQRYK